MARIISVCNQKGGIRRGCKYILNKHLVETTGIEEAYRDFSKYLKTPNLQKNRNLPIMPLCAVISQNGDIFGNSFLESHSVKLSIIVDFELKLTINKIQPLENKNR